MINVRMERPWFAAAILAAMTMPALAACGPNSTLGEYQIGAHGERVWCEVRGAGGFWQTVLAFIASLFDFAEYVGGGKTALGALALVVIGVFLTGSERVRVRTYRDSILVKDEIQGGVQALTDDRFMHFMGNLMKIVGLVMFFVGTLNFGSHLHLF